MALALIFAAISGRFRTLQDISVQYRYPRISRDFFGFAQIRNACILNKDLGYAELEALKGPGIIQQRGPSLRRPQNPTRRGGP
jgi:hypothetical protein